ncbi:MAG: T9SS type A sorting domain-containing protein [Dysgonamonadaceae bacterium]|jgi:hypothetical protein|nr:T9SS type A sorting domain-containing protein [Dysgonamonadaceae bacterium]
MRKFVTFIVLVAMGSSLFAQRDLGRCSNRTQMLNLPIQEIVASPENVQEMTWTAINLPYSELVTYDDANCEYVANYYLTRGFYFTLTETSNVVINGPWAWAYYYLYDSRDITTAKELARGYAIYATLDAGTYYIATDDNGCYYFKDMDGQYLTQRMNVYFANGTYPSYTTLPYSQELNSSASVAGQMNDTVLVFTTSVGIIHSTVTPYYLNIEENKSYKITCTITSDNTEDYAGGLYILDESLTGTSNDLKSSLIIDGGKSGNAETRSRIYNATYTGIAKILPVAFTGGVSYTISVEPMETYLLPEALDIATSLATFPHTATGNIETGILINAQDGSVIGSTDYSNQLYNGFPFKIDLNESDKVNIAMNIDYLNVYNLGYIYLFEKTANNAYNKIGEVGFPQTPAIEFVAPEKMDLYILTSIAYLMPYPNATGMTYELSIDKSPMSLPDITVESINIYPNPASEVLQITNYELQKGEYVEIMDITGKVVIISETCPVNVSSLAKGIYFAKIANKIGKFIKK